MPYGWIFRMVKAGATIPDIAAAFAVSPAMARCRVNRTGLLGCIRSESQRSDPPT